MLFRSNLDRGWVLGSPHCSWDNKNIIKFKELYFKYFYTYENCLFNSFNNFLKLQWYCQIKNITLINLTFKSIFPGNYDNYTTVKHLVNMVDFDKWIFYNDVNGLYEYTRDNNLEFYDDNFHPTPDSHKHYVENFLLKNKLISELICESQ